jgi:hypothetical protein
MRPLDIVTDAHVTQTRLLSRQNISSSLSGDLIISSTFLSGQASDCHSDSAASVPTSVTAERAGIVYVSTPWLSG